MEQAQNKGFLGWIERVGNKMPHPLMLFIYVTLIIMILSFILSMLGVSALHPGTKETIFIKNLISLEAFAGLTSNFAYNVFTFPVLTNVLILATVSGLCEKIGFFTAAIRMVLKMPKGIWLSLSLLTLLYTALLQEMCPFY